MTTININAQDTPDIWGVYPENARLRNEVSELYKEGNELMGLVSSLSSSLEQLKAYNLEKAKDDTLKYASISTFLDWLCKNYTLDYSHDIWENLEGLFDLGLIRDPRRKSCTISVQRTITATYEVDMPYSCNTDSLQRDLNIGIPPSVSFYNSHDDVPTTVSIGDEPCTLMLGSYSSDQRIYHSL